MMKRMVEEWWRSGEKDGGRNGEGMVKEWWRHLVAVEVALSPEEVQAELTHVEYRRAEYARVWREL